MVTLVPPICLCGFMPDGRMVLGGAFQMADTLGFPLVFSLDEAEKKNCVISMPHYFASAIEHGWDDKQAFGKIREALVDRGDASEMERVKDGCIAMFMDVARAMPDASVIEIAGKMRQRLEDDTLAHFVAYTVSKLHKKAVESIH